MCNAFDIHLHALLLRERPPLLLWWIFFHSGVIILLSSFSTEKPSQEYNCNISTGLWCMCCGCPPPEVFLHGGSRAKAILHCRALLWRRLRLTLKKVLEQMSCCCCMTGKDQVILEQLQPEHPFLVSRGNFHDRNITLGWISIQWTNPTCQSASSVLSAVIPGAAFSTVECWTKAFCNSLYEVNNKWITV